jgi:hypothetical protein
VPVTAAPIAVHAARDYLSPPSLFGSEYYVDTSTKNPGPIDSSEKIGTATDTWELWQYGNGDHLLDARALVFPSSTEADTWLVQQPNIVVGESAGTPQTPPAWAGQDASAATEPFHLDNGTRATLGRLVWRRGRVAFDVRYRDDAGTYSNAALFRLASALDQRAANLGKS